MQLLTVREAAKLMSLSTRKVYNLITSGRLSHYRIDNAIRVAVTDVEDYLANCLVMRQPQVEVHAEGPMLHRTSLDRNQEPVKTSHLNVGPRQLALLRRGGVGISGPNGHSGG